MKNWTIGKKLVFGFAAILVITVALGTLSYINGRNIADTSDELAYEVTPVAIASSDVCANAMEGVFQVRGYFLYKEQKYIDDSLELLRNVEKSLGDVVTVAKNRNLPELLGEAENAKDLASQYIQCVSDYFDLMKQFDTGAGKMGALGKRMSDVLKTYGEGQKEKLAADIAAANTSQAALNSRLKKVDLFTKMSEQVTYTRVNTALYINTADDAQARAALDALAELHKHIVATEPLLDDQADKDMLAEVKQAVATYQAGIAELQGIDEKMAANDERRAPMYSTVLELANKLLAESNQKVKQSSENTVNSVSTANTLTIGGIILALVVGSGLAYLIIRSLTRALSRIATSLGEGSTQVAAASNQVSAASQSLAEGASEQAASIEETSSSIEEMSSMTKQNASNANEAKTLADTARDSADRGSDAMDRMSKAIDDIKTSSDETAKIVKTIDEIAFQTNLLALNAAVEAARAGEAGKGFAVVAEEVRNLAQRSAEAAKNTAEMIEQSVRNADNGVSISREVAQRLGEIADGNRKVNDLVGEIAAASNEQATGIDQVNTAVGQMDQVTQTNAANAEESASAAEELNAQAEELNRMVAELNKLVGGREEASGSSSQDHQGETGHHFIAQKPRGTSTKTRPADGQPNTQAHASTAEHSIPFDHQEELSNF
jgi:methyl-accepting chemotaxis protein